MTKIQSVTIEVLPVCVIDQGVKLLELRRIGIRSQNFEVRKRRVQINSKPDEFLDTLFGVLEKADHVKGCGRDSQLPAKLDHSTHMFVRDEAAGYLFEHKWIGRLNPEIDCSQARGVHLPDQLLIKVVHPRFAFKGES